MRITPRQRGQFTSRSQQNSHILVLVHANQTLFHPFNTAVVENRYWTARAMHAFRSFLSTQRPGSMLNSIFRLSSLPYNWAFEC